MEHSQRIAVSALTTSASLSAADRSSSMYLAIRRSTAASSASATDFVDTPSTCPTAELLLLAVLRSRCRTPPFVHCVAPIVKPSLPSPRFAWRARRLAVELRHKDRRSCFATVLAAAISQRRYLQFVLVGSVEEGRRHGCRGCREDRKNPGMERGSRGYAWSIADMPYSRAGQGTNRENEHFLQISQIYGTYH